MYDVLSLLHPNPESSIFFTGSLDSNRSYPLHFSLHKKNSSEMGAFPMTAPTETTSINICQRWIHLVSEWKLPGAQLHMVKKILFYSEQQQ